MYIGAFYFQQDRYDNELIKPEVQHNKFIKRVVQKQSCNDRMRGL